MRIGSNEKYIFARRRKRTALIALSCLAPVVLIAGALVLPGTVFRPGQSGGTPVSTNSGILVPEATSAPTPLFATSCGLRLYLPVDPAELTIIGYHQATNDAAQKIRPAKGAKRNWGRSRMADPVGRSLRPVRLSRVTMWRTGRTGTPDRAVDVGADPGTPVYSPVDGTITRVKWYRLYDKYADFEVHITPQGTKRYEVVIIHVAKPVVHKGSRVKAGIDLIGQVRNLSRHTALQLGQYTKNAGDHVHLQVNLRKKKK